MSVAGPRNATLSPNIPAFLNRFKESEEGKHDWAIFTGTRIRLKGFLMTENSKKVSRFIKHDFIRFCLGKRRGTALAVVMLIYKVASRPIIHSSSMTVDFQGLPYSKHRQSVTDRSPCGCILAVVNHLPITLVANHQNDHKAAVTPNQAVK